MQSPIICPVQSAAKARARNEARIPPGPVKSAKCEAALFSAAFRSIEAALRDARFTDAQTELNHVRTKIRAGKLDLIQQAISCPQEVA